MFDVEDQIRELSDYTFERSEPVEYQREENYRSGWTAHRRPYPLAAAAVLAVVVISVGLLTEVGDRLTNNDSIDVATSLDSLTIEDPLNVNLDPIVADSPARRLAAIGPVLTFDFDNLPAGYVATENSAFTISGLGTGPSYRQQVMITGPENIRLVVNITGRLDGGDIAFDNLLNDHEAIEVRDQEGRVSAGFVEWIERGRVIVSIGDGSGFRDNSEERLALARVLEPVDAQIGWSLTQQQSGPSLADREPLLSGEVAGVDWAVVTTNTGLELGVGENLTIVGGTPRTEPSDPLNIDYSIDPLPGAVIVFGVAPSQVDVVELNLETGLVELPVAQMSDGRMAFAVPIDDRLDPTSIDFLDADRTLLASISLVDLPPYLGGSTGSGTQISNPSDGGN